MRSAQAIGTHRDAPRRVRSAALRPPACRCSTGIPFAAAPVGDLRFREARPPKPWNGILDGTKWGNTCIQPPAPTRPIGVNQATDMPDSPPMSEDCLNLNVWTPAANAGDKLPVMVWFYGGAYNEGGGSMPFADGSNLAKKGVIVVSLNYRVGALGFLSHPELTATSPNHASGNQALSDSIAALQWVQQNIAAFGGDPNNVTIFGQSAGACITAALVGSPVADGLFQRAISQSGAWAGLTAAPMGSREKAEQEHRSPRSSKLGVKTLAELQALPAEKLAGDLRNQGIIIDGWIVPEDLSKTFADGRQSRVDVLLGSNANEGGSFGGFGPPVTLASWQGGAAQRWGGLAETGMAAYPAATDAEAKVAATRPFTDWHRLVHAPLRRPARPSSARRRISTSSRAPRPRPRARPTAARAMRPSSPTCSARSTSRARCPTTAIRRWSARAPPTSSWPTR